MKPGELAGLLLAGWLYTHELYLLLINLLVACIPLLPHKTFFICLIMVPGMGRQNGLESELLYGNSTLNYFNNTLVSKK